MLQIFTKCFCCLRAKRNSIVWNSNEMKLISLTDFEPLDSNQRRYQWHVDLFLLLRSVNKKLYRFVLNMDDFKSWGMLSAEELRDYVEQNGVSRVSEYVTSKLDAWKNVVIQFAVCGVSGAGKSTFINRIRG